jgi:PAS domain S-box-containing protein
MDERTAQIGALDHHLFYEAFNASPIGIALENLEGQPIFVNPALCSMLGYSEEEMRSKRCVEFSPPEDAEKDWALFQQLCAGERDHYHTEKRFFRRDGSMLWGRLSISLLRRSSPLVVAMVQDITDKKTAEETRFRHAAIVESSEDAIISEDLDRTILSWNAGAQRIFGYTEAEAIGQSAVFLIPPELRDKENRIFERLRTGERIEPYETLRVTKAGNKVDVSLSISPVKDSSGRIFGFSKIARDITERKLAEEVVASLSRKVV